MKKSEQEKINEKCKEMTKMCMDEISTQGGLYGWSRLRSCQAQYAQTRRFVVLQSYGTLVAFIDKNTDTLYDILRWVYGYTATSAQHIAKFNHDCGYGKWGCTERLTYR